MSLLNKKWVQSLEGLHPNPTMCQALRCKRLNQVPFCFFFCGEVGCDCYFPDFCTCTGFLVENLEAAIEVGLQGRERLRRIGSSKASCQWALVRKQASFGSCTSFSPKNSGVRNAFPPTTALPFCQRIAGERGFSCLCWDSASSQTVVFSGAWSPFAVALCIFHPRRNWGQTQWRALLPGSHWELSSSLYLLSLTSRCQITRLGYCLCAENLTDFEERQSRTPSRLILSEESLVVCKAPIGEIFSIPCFARPLLSSPVCHNMQILLFLVSFLQRAYTPTCYRNWNIFSSLILLGISFLSVVDLKFLFQKKVP